MRSARLSVAFRLIAGLGSLIIALLAVSAIAFVGLTAQRATLDMVTASDLPTLLAASQLAQKSQSLVSTAPALVVADSQFARRSVAERLHDLIEGLDELIATLDAAVSPRHDLTDIRALRTKLVDNLYSLNAAVETRIEADQTLQATALRIRRVRAAIDSMELVGDAVRWVDRTDRVLDAATEMLTASSPATLTAQRSPLEAQMRLLRLEAPPDAARIVQDLEALASGKTAVADAKQRHFDSVRSIQAQLAANRFHADRFVSAVRTLVRSIETQLQTTSDALHRETGDRLWAVGILMAACIVAAALTLIHIDRSIVRRLIAVRAAMLSHVAGRQAAIPREGNDEITDIGKSLHFFVTVIGQREEALRSAKERAEKTAEELRITQRQLVQAEKMASMGQLVAGVAHEVNTPVGVALTAASMISDDIADLRARLAESRLTKADLVRFLDNAEKAGELAVANIERTADLIQNFKLVAADHIAQSSRQFDLRHQLEEAIAGLEPLWKEGGHTLHLACPSGLVVESYPEAFSHILSNLITNSVTHAFEPGQSGHLSVTVSEPDPQTVELIFADDGRGIPDQDRPKIFDPFFTTGRNVGRVGLGLHVVFNIVTAKLQGRIELDAAAAEGTRFVLRFPRIVRPSVPFVTESA